MRADDIDKIIVAKLGANKIKMLLSRAWLSILSHIHLRIGSAEEY